MAIVGAVGFIVGGLVGGLFALWAVHRQLVGDLSEKRADESHQSAMDVAEALGPLERAFRRKAVG